MYAELKTAQKFFDKFSIGLSVLCALHCLFLPSFLIILSSFMSIQFDNEFIHYMILFLVVPISIFALTAGLKNHKSFSIFLLGLVGLITLIYALFLNIKILGDSGEIILTLFGSTFVSLAHLKNYQLCKHIDCDCHE